MAEYLTSDQVKEWKAYFDLLDKDGKGKLTPKELGTVMKSIHLSVPEEEIKGLLSEINTNGASEIDFQDFLKLISRKMKDVDTKEEMQQVFKEFDKGGKGFINVEDLKAMSSASGENYTIDELNEMLKEADVDHDGVLNFEDFSRMMMAK